VSQNTLHKLPFCIPSHTAAQTIRIRILCNKSTGDYLSFCPTLGYGEIEDYNITVIEPYQNNIYCTPSSVSATGRQGYINNVTIGAINNFNTGGQYYYSIRPETSQLAKNTNNTATVKVSSAGQVGLYIDYDQDGDFESAGSIQSANINTMTATIPFTVPASAMLGITRMRVVYGKNSYVSSCPTSSFGGEVEDYYVEIVNSVGVEETTNLTEFSVYPNPAQDGAQLHLKFNTPEQTSVIISNSFGENIQLFCFNEITEINENLKFENLPSGVFFIKVVTEKEVKVLKFVKL
jgi:hypothetical protein